jgi:hypothetical protein
VAGVNLFCGAKPPLHMKWLFLCVLSLADIGDCSFGWYWWNCCSSRFKLSCHYLSFYLFSITTYKHSFAYDGFVVHRESLWWLAEILLNMRVKNHLVWYCRSLCWSVRAILGSLVSLTHSVVFFVLLCFFNFNLFIF